jgi:hypothetical protein
MTRMLASSRPRISDSSRAATRGVWVELQKVRPDRPVAALAIGLVGQRHDQAVGGDVFEDVGAGEHGVHARQRHGAAHIDRPDARVRMWASQERGVKHAIETDVTDEAAAP